MCHRFFLVPFLSVILVSNGSAKCIFAPTLRANVSVHSCVAVTFQPSDLGIEIVKGNTSRLYQDGSSYSGTLLSVTVKSSRFVWDVGEKHETNGFHVWTPRESRTLFIAKSADVVCPAKYNDTITVETDRYCCDVLPLREKCLVPGSVDAVSLPPK
jgi:hypothetical protein